MHHTAGEGTDASHVTAQATADAAHPGAVLRDVQIGSGACVGADGSATPPHTDTAQKARARTRYSSLGARGCSFAPNPKQARPGPPSFHQGEPRRNAERGHVSALLGDVHVAALVHAQQVWDQIGGN